MPDNKPVHNHFYNLTLKEKACLLYGFMLTGEGYNGEYPFNLDGDKIFEHLSQEKGDQFGITLDLCSSIVLRNSTEE